MATKRLTNLASMDPQNTVDFYDKMQDKMPGFNKMAKEILKLGINDGNLLDIACGPGHLLFKLAMLEPKLKLSGLDISPNMLEACKKKFKKQGIEERLKVFEGSAYELPFEENSFDIVISSLSLHYMDDPLKYFQEMVRVMKPGGLGWIFSFRRDIPKLIMPLLRLHSGLRKKRRGIEGMGEIIDASLTPQEADEYLKELEISKYELKKTRFTMTILLYK